MIFNVPSLSHVNCITTNCNVQLRVTSFFFDHFYFFFFYCVDSAFGIVFILFYFLRIICIVFQTKTVFLTSLLLSVNKSKVLLVVPFSAWAEGC